MSSWPSRSAPTPCCMAASARRASSSRCAKVATCWPSQATGGASRSAPRGCTCSIHKVASASPTPDAPSMTRPLSDVTTGLYIITATCGLIDAVCFLALGGVFAEMMTGNLLLMALSIGTGNALGDTTRYLPAMLAFMVGALLGGRLLRGPKKLQERRRRFVV